MGEECERIGNQFEVKGGGGGGVNCQTLIRRYLWEVRMRDVEAWTMNLEYKK